MFTFVAQITRFVSTISSFFTRELFGKFLSFIILFSMTANAILAFPHLFSAQKTRTVAEIPTYSFASPEPFQVGQNNYHLLSKNNSLAFAFSIWDDLSSWFSSGEAESAENNLNTCPSGYTSLGPALLGTPSAAVLGNRLMVFVRGTDNALYWKYTENGSDFSNWIGLGGGTYSDPRTLVSNGTLYIEVTGTDNNLYYQATTNGGNNWSGWISGTVNAQNTPNASFLGLR